MVAKENRLAGMRKRRALEHLMEGEKEIKKVENREKKANQTAG
jgi:hypothetical protein